MLSLKVKDLANRALYLKNEKAAIVDRFLFINLLNQTKKKKKKLFLLFLLLQRNKNSKLKFKMRTKLVRRCAISNRGRGNFRLYGISRFLLRNFMQFGVLPGFKKAVW